MKSRLIILSFILIYVLLANGCYVSTGTGSNTVVREEVRVEREYNADDLNPYGRWINTAEYGRVWQPFDNQDWQPYNNGHWVYDGYNWIWDSNERYAPIVYHYGYWVFTSYNGWVWIPSYDKWSPARVTWVHNGEMVCWAPMTPKGVFVPEPWERNNRYWYIVKTQDFYRENVTARRIRNIDSPTAFSRNQYERAAPDVKTIERSTNQTVRAVTYERGIDRNRNLEQRNPQGQTNVNPAGRSTETNPGTRDRGNTPNPGTRERNPEPTPVVKEKTTTNQLLLDGGTVEKEKKEPADKRSVERKSVQPEGRDASKRKNNAAVKPRLRSTDEGNKKEAVKRAPRENAPAREKAAERKADRQEKKTEKRDKED